MRPIGFAQIVFLLNLFPSTAWASDYSGVAQGLAAMAVGVLLGAISVAVLLCAAIRRAPEWLTEGRLNRALLIVVSIGLLFCLASAIDRSAWDEDFLIIMASVLGPGAVAGASSRLLFRRVGRAA